MAARRFLPEDERTRRGAGWTFIVLSLAAIGGLGWLAGFAPRLNVTSIVLFGLPAAFLALGLRFVLRPKLVFAIDLDERTYAVVRNGARISSGPLDSLGPLTASERTPLAAKGTRYKHTVYVVNAAVHSDIDLYVRGKPGEARRKMEELARRLHLPCQSWRGDVRRPEDLDTPLVERLRRDSAARAAMTLQPAWGLRVEPLATGYAIVPASRSWAPLMAWALAAAVLVAIVGRGFQGGFPDLVQDLKSDLMTQVLASLAGLVVVAALWKLGGVAREALAPAPLRITEAGVAYRGSTVALADVREVTASLPIEIFGRRRTLKLAETFCPKGAVATVTHEIQRMILEVAPLA